MNAIDPSNLEAPYDPYEELEVYKVVIIWDNDIYAVRHFPILGYETDLALNSLKREFFSFVEDDIGDALDFCVWSKELNEEDIVEREEVDMNDSATMLSVIPKYPTSLDDYKVRYYTKDIEDYLKDHSEKWLKVDTVSFYTMPACAQRYVREWIEEHNATLTTED